MNTTSSRTPLPSVWRTFERTINGELRQFWVQDLPEDQIELALEYMQSYFFRDEPLIKAANLLEDKAATSSFRKYLRTLFIQRCSLGCYTKLENGNDKLVGVNCCMKKSKEEKEPDEIRLTENVKKLFNIVEYVENLRDPYETLGISEYLASLGLIVIPEYRGHNIGLELLCARKSLCIALGLRASVTSFTAPSSQRLAEKAGFKDLISITYDEIEERNADFKVPNINEYSKRIRFMYILYE
ncbi:hypothetical protein HHI36_006651 [Cryptolaemus montrouzieri]|uniref:N-acetyltransferase domain-containing protein n=1 Tax=Cryptolaemus montrouzieri TaxID=559131 RepID=A0ABD2NYS6_9CUCU